MEQVQWYPMVNADLGDFGAIAYDAPTRKLYGLGVIESHSQALCVLIPTARIRMRCIRGCCMRLSSSAARLKNRLRQHAHLRAFVSLSVAVDQAVAWRDNVADQHIHRTTRQKPFKRFNPDALRPLPPVLPDGRQTPP